MAGKDKQVRVHDEPERRVPAFMNPSARKKKKIRQIDISGLWGDDGHLTLKKRNK